MRNVLDLLRAMGIEPKKAAGTNGGEWSSSCPGCGGNDRFRTWPEENEGDGSYWCRGCGASGDNIQFLRDFQAMDFRDACAALGRDLEDWRPRPRPVPDKPAAWEPKRPARPEADWRVKAKDLAAWAHANLLTNKEQLAWLAARGIPEPAVREFSLGWNKGEKGQDIYRPLSSWGLPEEKNEQGRSKRLWIPRGLVIPGYSEGEMVRLRFRPTAGENRPKYITARGSSGATMVLRPEARAFVVVEAELDAMACAWAARVISPGVGAMAVLTNRGKPDAVAARALARAEVILVALDADQPDAVGKRAGALGWPWWREQYGAAARFWPVPRGKDPGEFCEIGGDLADWIMAGLPPAWSIGPSPFERQSRGGRVLDWPALDGAGGEATREYRETREEAVAMGVRIKVAAGRKPEPVYPEDLAARFAARNPGYDDPAAMALEWREWFEGKFRAVAGEVERLLNVQGRM